MKKDHLALLLSLGWLIITTVLLTIPGTRFPKEDWLSKIWFDKWVHIGLFAVLVYCWCWYFSKKFNRGHAVSRSFLFIAGLALLYGTGMEFVQKYCVAYRSFDGGDIIADGLGCLLGAWVAMKRFIKNKPL